MCTNELKIVYTQRNDPISARRKSFCENLLGAKRISFGIKYIAENNFDSQIKIIYSWSKRIQFASSGRFCACRNERFRFFGIFFFQ